VVHQLQQGRPEIVDIDDNDGLLVQAQARPAEGFNDLFQSADAAGQGAESVRLFEHDHFAFMHVLNDLVFNAV